MVNQGDFLHGDANGVTNIPLDIVGEVADICDDFVAAEAIMLDYVKVPGAKSVAKFDELRLEFMSVIGKLKERVARH